MDSEGAFSQSEAREAFIDLAVRCDVLKFGDFELKSGRVSPYFFNAGAFATGAALATLGACYAATMVSCNLVPDTLFGPAYKGIPLASTTAVALALHHAVDIPYAFNRKEAKAHGEGGVIVGAPLKGHVAIVDDVITAGTAIRESVQLISEQGAVAAGVIIGLDRCERGQGALSAVQEVQEEFGLRVISVINLHDVIEWLAAQGDRRQYLDAMLKYRDNYGV
ncbi:MAG: orotate phosphoribosyltransferase [Proteobacteria bacterium]|nr:orotate phosphoribosyltransferase [Pseudomonadota bacterium]MDA1208342.1 orotate phosphoribosyltransferase [Pseudomonadota bacterium]